MKKTVPFNLFEEGQTIYFNITRLAELENAMGTSLLKIYAQQRDELISFYLNALRIGLAHHYEGGTEGKTNSFFAEKIEKYLDKGGKITDFITPISEAILVSGIWGKPADSPDERPEEKNGQGPFVQ